MIRAEGRVKEGKSRSGRARGTNKTWGSESMRKFTKYHHGATSISRARRGGGGGVVVVNDNMKARSIWTRSSTSPNPRCVPT